MNVISLDSSTVDFVNTLALKESWPAKDRDDAVQSLLGLGVFSLNMVSSFQQDVDKGANLNGLKVILARRIVEFYIACKTKSKDNSKEDVEGRVSNLYYCLYFNYVLFPFPFPF